MPDAEYLDAVNSDPEYLDPNDEACTNPAGHVWTYTGTQYGGDDARWNGEGRCLCVHCGADGDT